MACAVYAFKSKGSCLRRETKSSRAADASPSPSTAHMECGNAT